jgi:hypothetical protein
MTSVKKLGSRLSSILPGRGRSSVAGSVDKSKSIVGVDEKTAPTANIASLKANATNANSKRSTDGRVLLTKSKNSGMELKCSGLIVDDDAALVVRLLVTHHQMLTTDGLGRTI